MTMHVQASSTTMKDDECLRIFVLFVLSATTSLNSASNSFNEVPVSQEVPPWTDAVFRCQHSSADFTAWKFNNSFVGGTPPTGVSRGTTNDEDGTVVDILTVTARLEYNNTLIQCVAYLAGVPEPSEPPAVLMVQEKSNITTTTPGQVDTGTSTSLEGFTEGPYSKNVTAGAIVDFECVHQSFDVDWEINGTMLGGGHFPPGLLVAKHIQDGGHARHVLTVNTSQEYDNTHTTLACVLEDYPPIRTEVAVLRVQGPLDAPSHLHCDRDYTTNTTTITWTPPPSINLTNVEPDIVYCIEVENITCGERGNVIVSECGITEPIYQSRDIPLNYIYIITVTPMSNVEGALNGTPAYLEEEFPTLNEISTVFSSPDSTASAVVTMDITDHQNEPLPSFCSLSLTPVGTINSTLKPTTDVIRNYTIVLYANCLEEQMLLYYKVVAYTCSSNALTNGSLLNTHYARDISVSSPASGEITVTGDFLNSSTTTGLLVITYTSSSNVRYHLYSRTPNEQNFRTVINNLEAGDYHVSVFTVENGLPVGEVATLPQRVHVLSHEGLETKTIDYKLKSTSTGICITCTFLESSTATDCVAVVHQRISQLNSSTGLMNIESSHKFTRSGVTASGCIEGVNLEVYEVGVVGGRLLESASSSDVCIGCISGSVLAVIFFGGSVLFVIVIVYIGRKYHRKKYGRRSRANSVNNEESGLPGHSTANHYEIVYQQDEKKQESTPLVTLVPASRVRADSSGSGGLQLQPESLATQFEEASFTTSPLTPHRASNEVGLPGALPESTYAEPALLARPSVSIPPVTERSTYSSVENFQNPQGLTYALLEHVSLMQHNPQPDDQYRAKYEYSELLIKKEECSKTKEGGGNKEKVAPQSVPPPTPCDTENLGKLLYPISCKWEKFAVALSLDEDHISDVIDDVIAANETDEACLQDVMERYFDNGDFRHNWEEIVAILRGVDEQLANKIHDLHVYPYKSSFPGQTQDMQDSTSPVNSHSDVYIEHGNDGEKNEVVDSTQQEDGYDVASSSDDNGLAVKEQKQSPEEDIVTCVQESLSVSTELDHQSSQDNRSLELQTGTSEATESARNQTAKCFISLRRQDSMNSQAGDGPDYNYDGNHVYAESEGGVYQEHHEPIQTSGQGDSDEVRYATGLTLPSRDDCVYPKYQGSVESYWLNHSVTVDTTEKLGNCLWTFPEESESDASLCTHTSLVVEQETSLASDTDISKHHYIQQLRQVEAIQLRELEKWQIIATQTYNESPQRTSSFENVYYKQLRMGDSQTKRRLYAPFQRSTVF